MSEKIEPVAVIGPVWSLMFVGGASVAEIARKHGLSVGDKLYSATTVSALEARVKEQAGVLHEARRAIGDHFAPNDCYATGPVTGDEFRDLVECPACSFIAMYDTLTGAEK